MLTSPTLFAVDLKSAREIARRYLKDESFEISKVNSGWSGADVFKITKGTEKYLLKVDQTIPNEKWKQRLAVQSFISQHKLSPELVYSDEGTQAIISRFVEDHGFSSAYFDESQSDHVLQQFVDKVKTLHGLTYPGLVSEVNLLSFLQGLWNNIQKNSLPKFVKEVITEFERIPVLEKERRVFSHCDLNTSNILFDGSTVFLVDWDSTAHTHPFYDVATLATYLFMDEKDGEKLLELYEGGKVSPAEKAIFRYYRTGSYIVNGTMFLLQAKGILPSVDYEEVSSLRETFTKLAEGKLSLSESKGFQELSLSFFKEAEIMLARLK